MKKTVLFLALALVFTLIPSVSMAADDYQTKQIPYDVESGVICILDNCMMNLASCDSAAAQKERDIIREKMFKEGMNKDQVYAYLAQTYGEKILAAPTKKGFNWIAWIMPFVAIVGGAAVVYLGLEKWVIPSRELEAEGEDVIVDPLYQERLDKELKKYI